MTKEFKIVDENLEVTVNNSNTVYIPLKGERKEVGTYVQTTVQSIDKDKISVLQEFIEDELNNAKTQMDRLNEQYEPLKPLQDIDEVLLKQMRHALDKGSKAFKDSMKTLQQRINDLDKKKTLEIQIDYLSKQVEEMQTDLNSLLETIK